ncbi:hypothetical protein GZH47_14175 [Paenibacillus rhizovicinus]|uniref:Uncharacterized protein n=1 Tax=Paenibacillus rhizovicinus TaxID=2704463 RepID=A0A6C0P081_9BACL|nr:hypothetical protein [Paenibacillus rhizovicinus]QHW31867.1 hypothetical protein GZH47_14175 [Paenibacillus rhizovicinus]
MGGRADGTSIVRTITVAGADFDVPAPPENELVYSAFVSTSNLGPIRFGPESFYATAFSDF